MATLRGTAALAVLCLCGSASAQEPPAQPTEARSLLTEALSRASLGGYGELHLENRGRTTEVRLERLVISIGYRFTDWLRFFSETELEDAHEVEVEQAYLEASLNTHLGLRAGLMLMPISSTNLTHEPTTFFSVDRSAVDTLVLPSTWREVGLSVYGEAFEGLQYQLGLYSGLQGPGLSVEGGLRDARGQGFEVHTEQPAIAGRLTFNRVLGLELSASFYFSGAGQAVSELKALRVGLIEFDGRYKKGGFEARALYARVFLSGAEDLVALQRAAAPAVEPVGSAMQAVSAEAGYDVLKLVKGVEHELIPFARYELVDTRAAPALVDEPGGSRATHFLTVGLCYRPHPQVAVKADWRRTLAQAPGVGEDLNRLMVGVGVSY